MVNRTLDHLDFARDGWVLRIKHQKLGVYYHIVWGWSQKEKFSKIKLALYFCLVMMNTEVLGYIGTQFSEIPMYSNQQKYDILVCPGVCNPILWPLQNGKTCRYTNGFEVYAGFGQSYINRNTLPTNLGGELVKLDQFYLGFTQFVE